MRFVVLTATTDVDLRWQGCEQSDSRPADVHVSTQALSYISLVMSIGFSLRALHSSTSFPFCLSKGMREGRWGEPLTPMGGKEGSCLTQERTNVHFSNVHLVEGSFSANSSSFGPVTGGYCHAATPLSSIPPWPRTLLLFRQYGHWAVMRSHFFS